MGSGEALALTPISLREANAFVERNHRHHKGVTGHKFSIGCTRDGAHKRVSNDWERA